MKRFSVSQIAKTRKLKLSKWQYFWHYFLGIVPLPISIDYFYKAYCSEISGILEGLTIDELLSGVFWLFLGLSILFFKWYRLKFRQFDISLTPKDFKNKINRIAELKKWTVINNTNDYAELNGGSLFTWGLKITIVRREGCVLVNSICDPDRPACISIFFENEKNIIFLKKFFNPATDD